MADQECPWHRHVDERAPVKHTMYGYKVTAKGGKMSGNQEPITMRIGYGGGGFGDALATRPCARLMAAFGHNETIPVCWATRFPLVYDGLIETVPYDEPKGQLLELHWAIYPEGIKTFYRCYYDQAEQMTGYDWSVIDPVRPVWPFHRKPKPIIAINTYAGLPERRWPVDRWQDIADRLIADGWIVVQVNGAASGEFLNCNQEARQNPNEMAHYLSTCAMYLGNHSALWQIAMGVECPSVTVHGLSCPHWFNVNPQLHRTIEAKGECRYCYDRGPWNVGDWVNTPYDHESHEAAYKAMREKAAHCGQPCIDHSVDEVWWTIKDHLAVTWRGGVT
ncbi:MAG: glycosyltransferase family 9 protein [Planctomycetota bacterium]